MRLILIPGSLLVVALWTAPAQAQQKYPAEMVINVAEVEVRSGPSKEYFPTTKLRGGQRVLVLRESSKQPGWLAIAPPPGSFSWINAKHVKQVNANTGYVDPQDGAPVPVLPGSSLINKAPNVEAVKLQPGHLVVILDKPYKSDSGTWLPIKPPPTEVRFIPADAVRAQFAAQPFPGAAPAGNALTPLIRQADQAYVSGNLAQARQLYKQAADTTTDTQQKNYCLNRLASLGQGSWTPPKGQVAATGINPAAATKTIGQTTSMTSTPGNPALGQPKTPQWSVWGTLRRAAFTKDGQPMYVLENAQGQPLLYVSTQPGTSLSGYVGRTVSLYGTLTYRSDEYMRMYHMQASHVATP